MIYDNEIWKDIPGYEGNYKVSDFGRVKSIDRIVKKNGLDCKTLGRIRTLSHKKSGYCHVILFKNKSRRTILVHRLVMVSFVGENKSKSVVNHKNGIKSDNRLENLEWTTYSENTIHAYKSGLLKKSGEFDKGKKLTSEEVFQIKKHLQENKMSYPQIGKKFNISANEVYKIKARKRWIHHRWPDNKPPKRRHLNLSIFEAIGISNDIKAGILTRNEIAEKYSSSPTQIGYMKSGARWSAVTGIKRKAS